MQAVENPKGKRGCRWALLACAVLLLLCVLGSVTNPSVRLTKQYGPELQAAYENYKSAAAFALGTGDTSQLANVATGYALENLATAAANEDAKTVAEWWKVEVLTVTVTHYSSDTAEATIEEKVVRDIARPGQKNVWIVTFERDGESWKVSGVSSYFTND